MDSSAYVQALVERPFHVIAHLTFRQWFSSPTAQHTRYVGLDRAEDVHLQRDIQPSTYEKHGMCTIDLKGHERSCTQCMETH
jgi:hypothetical protein